MNPIETAFAKLEAPLRQDSARTIDALVARAGHRLDRFIPSECGGRLLIRFSLAGTTIPTKVDDHLADRLPIEDEADGLSRIVQIELAIDPRIDLPIFEHPDEHV